MASLRVCTVGAGALGGYISAKIAQAGFDITVVDRGLHLDRIRRSGLLVIHPDGSSESVELRATEDLDAAGTHDLVILGVKAHQMEHVAPRLPALFHRETSVVTVQNGIPWWYFHRHGGPNEGRRLACLDPSGILEESIAAERVIGCVAYPAVTRPSPGVVQLVAPGKFPVGEPDGSVSERVQAISDVFDAAGLGSRVLTDIRAELWLKALGSVSFNPISALTRSTLVEICTDPGTRLLTARIMEEAQLIGQKLGIEFRRTIEERIAGAEGVGPHKTSMLQDVENGERLELDALVGAVVELGRVTGIPTPTINSVHALVSRLDSLLARNAVAR